MNSTERQTQISIFSGRGILIESQGPCWFYGTASEHSQLYQYQLLNAKNIYFGHMQTETPYYQPVPDATGPIKANIGGFPYDPDFKDCAGKKECMKAWALRVIKSSNIYVYSAGFYSFFQDYSLACLPSSCQSRLIQTSFTQSLWMYNLFTVGSAETVSPAGGLPAVNAKDNQDGFSTEIAAWLTLSEGGGALGDSSGTPRACRKA